MNKFKNPLICIFLLIIGLNGHTVIAAEINLGVQAPRSKLKAVKRWTPLGNYLEKELHTTVKIIPLKPDETLHATKSGLVNYILSNPVLTITLQKQQQSKPLLTMVKPSGKYFAGVIITKKGNGITKAADLKGKKVMGFKFKRSAAAYVFQVKHLLDQGVDPHKDFAVFYEAKTQDDIVLAVRAGVFDAGFIKSGLLESMKNDGISIDDFTIIDQQNDILKNVHSTKLYPEWCLSAAKTTSKEQQLKIKQSLLKLKENDVASKAARIKGFVEALPLDDLKATLKQLKLPPYDN